MAFRKRYRGRRRRFKRRPRRYRRRRSSRRRGRRSIFRRVPRSIPAYMRPEFKHVWISGGASQWTSIYQCLNPKVRGTGGNQFTGSRVFYTGLDMRFQIQPFWGVNATTDEDYQYLNAVMSSARFYYAFILRRSVESSYDETPVTSPQDQSEFCRRVWDATQRPVDNWTFFDPTMWFRRQSMRGQYKILKQGILGGKTTNTALAGGITDIYMVDLNTRTYKVKLKLNFTSMYDFAGDTTPQYPHKNQLYLICFPLGQGAIDNVQGFPGVVNFTGRLWYTDA